MPSFPASIYSRPDPIPALMSDTPTHSTILGQYGDEIEGIEGTLGVNPQGASATVAARIAAQETATATTSWVALTGAAPGWSNFGGSYHGLSYRKRGDMVDLRGTILHSSGGSGTNIGTLPAGFRPTNHVEMVVKAGTGTGYITVFDNGSVLYTNSADGSALVSVSICGSFSTLLF